MKKKIFIIVPGLGCGGQERMAVATAEILNKQFDVKIIVFSDEEVFFKTSCEVINLDIPSKKSVLLKIIQQLKRIYKLRKLKKIYNISESYSLGTTANIANIFSKKTDKIFVSIRSFAEVRKKLLDKKIYQRAECITCISKEIESELIKAYPFLKSKTKVIYNGLDILNIKKMANKPIQFDKIKFTFVALSRLDKVKGLSHLLKSFAMLKKKYSFIKLVIIGDGEEKEKLINLTKELNIIDSVQFLGFKLNPYAYIKKCDVFVLTSINEGFGNVIIEAMACGLPIISTACFSGPLEILGENDYNVKKIKMAEYGILVPSFFSDSSDEQDKDKLLMEACEIMLTDDLIRTKYKKKSEERCEDFNLVKYEEKILDLFK